MSNTLPTVQDNNSSIFSVIEQLSGKHIFITGVTGFVGKVLLTMIAQRIPQVRKLSVLIRSNKQFDNARDRFKAEVLTSEPFKAVRTKIDQELGQGQFNAWVDQVIQPITGDITQDQLGMSNADYHDLTQNDPIDIILHCAGNVNFDPPLNATRRMRRRRRRGAPAWVSRPTCRTSMR